MKNKYFCIRLRKTEIRNVRRAVFAGIWNPDFQRRRQPFQGFHCLVRFALYASDLWNPLWVHTTVSEPWQYPSCYNIIGHAKRRLLFRLALFLETSIPTTTNDETGMR